jgi:hypothetical protein
MAIVKLNWDGHHWFNQKGSYTRKRGRPRWEDAVEEDAGEYLERRLEAENRGGQGPKRSVESLMEQDSKRDSELSGKNCILINMVLKLMGFVFIYYRSIFFFFFFLGWSLQRRVPTARERKAELYNALQGRPAFVVGELVYTEIFLTWDGGEMDPHWSDELEKETMHNWRVPRGVRRQRLKE